MEPDAQTPRKDPSKSCCLSGCMLAAVVIFLLIGAVLWGAYSLYKNVYAYTAAAPVAVPLPPTTPEQYQAARQKFEDFVNPPAGSAAKAVRLSAADLNALVDRDPRLKNARGHVNFRIADGLLVVNVSAPLKDVRMMGDRYFNGEIAVDVKIENGSLALIPKRITSGENQTVSPEIIHAMRSFYWGDMITQNPEARQLLQNVKSIHIDNDQLVLEPK